MRKLLLAVAGVLGMTRLCSLSFGGDDTVVARGDWGEIHAHEIQAAGALYPSSTTKETLIKQIARDRLVSERALAANLDRESPTRWRVWVTDMNAGVREFLDRELAGQVHASTEELRRAYRERVNQYRHPETFSFRYIFADTTEKKTPAAVGEVRLRMEQARDELLKPLGLQPKHPWMVDSVQFQDAARKYSTVTGDPTRVAGPFTMEEPLQKAIKDVALSLQPGEMSEVFSTKYGFEIVRLESHVLAATDEFEKVAASLRSEIEGGRHAEAVTAFTDKLRAATDRYAIDEGCLGKLLPGADPVIPSATFVVRVGNTYWKPDDLKDFMSKMVRQSWLMAREKKAAKDLIWSAFILPQMLHEEVQKAGILEDPAVKARWTLERNGTLAGAWFNKEVERRAADLPEPSTQECLNRYDNQQDKFMNPPRYHLAWISQSIVDLRNPDTSPAKAEFLYREAEQRMKHLLSNLTEGASAEQVAQTASDATRPFEYVSKWLSRDSVFKPDLWREIENLRLGAWTGTPWRTSEGVVIVQLLEFLPGQPRPYEDVYTQIARQIQAEQTNQIKRTLLKELDAEVMNSFKLP